MTMSRSGDPAEPGGPPARSAEEFLTSAEQELLGLAIDAQRAEWVYETYITSDTAALTAKADGLLLQATARFAHEASRYTMPSIPPGIARRLAKIRLTNSEIPPHDPERAAELSQLAAKMRGHFASAKYIPKGQSEGIDLNEIGRIFARSRDPGELQSVWVGWHDTAAAIRPSYARFVELANQGAREVGFRDAGDRWRSNYDMSADDFTSEVQRLWNVVRPFYTLLHAYVRKRLHERYGGSVVPRSGPIPAHLLGNLWAQSWLQLLPLVDTSESSPRFDLESVLHRKSVTPKEMVAYAERFFTSLGLDPLPSTFWERSLLTRPMDREVLCHASAWDMDFDLDLRIKMCVDVGAEDFFVVHHEVGHLVYDRAYRHLPFLEREGANDGFHEALGDTIVLSMTPSYFREVGLMEPEEPSSEPRTLLLARALDKVAFLPFGLAVDEWRWKVFDGTIGADAYNRNWWRLREQYQGIAPPVPRGEEAFDPGAKM
ncbi:MAG: M2 family metallopeptidase, partial [Thermoplasmata archaeon]